MVVLIPSLKRLRSDFDLTFPNRDHASDGWIGDAAHQQSSSDHNNDETGKVPIRDADKVEEVHALDVDADLRTVGWTMERVVQNLLKQTRAGTETRLRYIIYNRRIWEADNGWKEVKYTGKNPHDKHAHFSGSYDTVKENDNRQWRLRETYNYAPVTGHLPMLRVGDRDQIDGFNMIRRVQRILEVADDGIYGDQTVAALARYPGMPDGYNGRYVSTAVWMCLYGLRRTPPQA